MKIWSTKKIGVFSTIVLLWLLALGLVIQREYFPFTRKQIKADYEQALKNVAQEKSTYMTIYYGVEKKSRIGEIQTTISPEFDGTCDIYSRTKLAIPLDSSDLAEHLHHFFQFFQSSGNQFTAEFQVKTHIGPDHQIKKIEFRLESDSFHMAYDGQVLGNKLQLTVRQGDQRQLHEISLPPGTMVTDNFGLLTKFPKLEIGKQFDIRYFDPLTKNHRTMVVHVVGKEPYLWGGKRITSYVLRTEVWPKTTTWVNEEGEILQYQVLSFTIIKEPPKHGNPAQKGLK